MAVELVAGTNSYISVADADTYFSGRLYSDSWTSAPDDQKVQALIMATRIINRQMFKGKKKDTDQALQFPRCYRVDREAASSYIGNLPEEYTGGQWLCDTTIPQAVKDACCEEALLLLGLTEYERNRNKQQVLGIIGGSVGSANEYSSASIIRANQTKTILCPEARELLRPWLAGAVNIT